MSVPALYTARQKQEALALLVESTLQNHAAAWIVEQRHRAFIVFGQAHSRQDRTAIMGDPVYYAEVLYQGMVAENTTYDGAGRPTRKAHRFSVDIYRHYADAATQAASSFDAWMDEMEASNPDKEGLLHVLEQTLVLDILDTLSTETGDPIVDEADAEIAGALGKAFLDNPAGAELNGLLNLDDEGLEWVHPTSFTIDVI